ncbi:MAG: aminoglycoside phosphotransferase family protein [Acidimicrobiia bacterium]|nr:aminoglycoside phosphotransferase family protein [Acidimicrobiia bacterium]
MVAMSPELSWLRTQLGPEARLGSQLTGGATSRVYSVEIGKRRAVLKQVTNRQWLQERPDVVAYEGRVLGFLSSTSIPVPQVLAVDADGAEAGFPSLLLSWIDGTPAGETARPAEWLDRLARVSAEIAAVEPPSWIRPFARYVEARDAVSPGWASDAGLWQAAIDAVGQPPPAAPARFIHRDYHPWNVLWNNEIVGVVDWSQASIGPIPMDAAHCRANLAIGFDVEVADQFTSRWEAATGVPHHPYWDLVTCGDFLPDWRPSDRGNERLEAWLRHLV